MIFIEVFTIRHNVTSLEQNIAAPDLKIQSLSFEDLSLMLYSVLVAT